MRTSGNLALKPTYREETGRYNERQKTTRANPKQVKKVNVAVAIFYIAIIFAIAFCLISREVTIYEKSGTVSQLTNQLEDAQAASKQAMLAAEAAVDLKSIEDVATNQYGMARPEKYQTVYININHDDYVETVAEKPAGQTAMNNIEKGISNLFGIFGVR